MNRWFLCLNKYSKTVKYLFLILDFVFVINQICHIFNAIYALTSNFISWIGCVDGMQQLIVFVLFPLSLVASGA